MVVTFFRFGGVEITNITYTIPDGRIGARSCGSLFNSRRIRGFVSVAKMQTSRHASRRRATSSLKCETTGRLLTGGGVGPRRVNTLLFISRDPSCHHPSATFILRCHLNLPGRTIYCSVDLNYSSLIINVRATTSVVGADSVGCTLIIIKSATNGSICPSSHDSTVLFNRTKTMVLLRGARGSGSYIGTLLHDSNSNCHCVVIPKNNCHGLRTDRRPIVYRSNGRHALVGDFVRNASMFAFAVFSIPQLVASFFTGARAAPSRCSYFTFRRTGLCVLGRVTGGAGVSFSQVPVALSHCKGASKTSTVMSLYSECKGNAKGGGVGIVTYNFNVNVSLNTASFRVGARSVLPVFRSSRVFRRKLVAGPGRLCRGG